MGKEKKKKCSSHNNYLLSGDPRGGALLTCFQISFMNSALPEFVWISSALALRTVPTTLNMGAGEVRQGRRVLRTLPGSAETAGPGCQPQLGPNFTSLKKTGLEFKSLITAS